MKNCDNLKKYLVFYIKRRKPKVMNFVLKNYTKYIEI